MPRGRKNLDGGRARTSPTSAAPASTREWRDADPELRARMLEQRTYYDEVMHRMLRDAGELSLGDGGERIPASYVMSAIADLTLSLRDALETA